MKFKFLPAIALVVVALLTGCQKEESLVVNNQVSKEALSKIHHLGFSTTNVQQIENGYLVEGDIFLSEKELNAVPDRQLLRVGTEEQYHTYNLVSRLPRVITISISNRLPSSYIASLDEAIARYNAEGLLITFKRVSSGADISLVRGSGSYLASAGFPTAAGDPHNLIKVNSNYIGKSPNQSYLASILAHEIGHCIGMRHTDYMDRSYSCGGQTANEGASTVGAIQVPGTPAAADPNSWMLACIGTGQNRPFNANDKTALNFLY